MKYREIIADNLKKRGWSLGYVSAIDSEGRTIWIVDVHRDGKRYVVRADEKLTAFIELESAIWIAANTANGANTLLSNTTGDFNTATGGTALYLNTTGSEVTRGHGIYLEQYRRAGRAFTWNLNLRRQRLRMRQ